METPIVTPPTGPTGPRTDEGKARTRLNAFRHGLTSREFVFSPEDAELYSKHSAVIQEHFQPTGPIQAGLVTSVANGMWRLERVAAIEEGIFTLAMDPDSEACGLEPARAWLANDRKLNLLTTYEQRIRRALAADKAELAKLQQSPAQAPKDAQPESVCSAPPAPPESVCSTPPVASKPPSPPMPTAASHVVLLVKGPATPPRRDAA